MDKFLQKRLSFYDNKEKPTPGTFYTVPKGSWLDSISQATYGYNRIADIISANPFLQRRKIQSTTGLPYIHPNDIIWLPPASNQKQTPDEIESLSKNEVSIGIDGKTFKGWETTSIQSNIDSVADSFVFTAPYDINNELSKLIDPFTYNDAEIYIGGKKFISGQCMKWTPNITDNNVSMTVEVRSKSGIINDCMSLDKSLDYKNMTLKQIAEKILLPFGLSPEFPDGDTDKFIKVNRQIDETIFNFLSNLAKQKGLLITSGDKSNKIIFTRADLTTKPIASFKQGEFPLIGINASYDGEQRFSNYIAISQSAGKPNNRTELQDKSIKLYRPIVFAANETESGNIKDAASWKISKSIVASTNISITIQGWHDPKNKLWTKNKKITLFYPLACIFRDTEFLITRVDFRKDSNGGNITNLNLVLPQAYSLNFPEVFPWQR